MSMRTEDEQRAGLDELARLIMRARCNSGIWPGRGDVLYLAALGPPEPSEVCYVIGGYDVWGRRPQTLLAVNLTIDQAAEVVIREYREWKSAVAVT